VTALLDLRSVSFFRHLETNPHGTRGRLRSAVRQQRNVISEITLRVNAGERVGILGANGAGKTTLLRLMAGIFKPDRGHIERIGQVSTFLDGGYGLDLHQTGRENAQTRLILARVRKSDQQPLLCAIEEFADLKEYFDQPVRSYSAGMLLRLIFAIGTVGEHEILLIDEGLGTADLGFQKKAVKRINEMYASSPIVVLASHNMDTLHQVCRRGVVIQSGSLVFDGPIDGAISAYQDLSRDQTCS